MNTITITSERDLSISHKNGFPYSILRRIVGLSENSRHWIHKMHGMPFIGTVHEAVRELENERTDHSEKFEIPEDGIYMLNHGGGSYNESRVYIQENGVLRELSEDEAIPSVKRMFWSEELERQWEDELKKERLEDSIP